MSFRDRLDVEALCVALGIRFERRGHNLVARCPNPEHDDAHPSWTIVHAPGTSTHGGHVCYSCSFGGGPWELVRAVRGLDEDEAQEFVTALILEKPRLFDGVPRVVIRSKEKREYRLPPGVKIPSVDGSQWHPVFFKYLVSRGVTPEQMERWRLGFATQGPLQWRVVIPIHTRGRLVAHVARAVFDDRQRYDMPIAGSGASPSSAIFGEPLVDPRLKDLTIAEGVFSALALERAIAPNPIALLGSAWTETKAAILSATQWRHVIIATDPDAAGDRVALDIARSFRHATISRLRMSHSPDDMELDQLLAAVAAVVGH